MSNYVTNMLVTKKVNDVLPFVYHDKQVRPLEEGVVSIASNTLQYGIGAFAGIRAFYQKEDGANGSKKGQMMVFRLKDHHTRLMNASKILGLDFYMSYDEFKDVIAEMIKKNAPTTDLYIRPFIHCDYLSIAPVKKPNVPYQLSVYMLSMGAYGSKALRLKISSLPKFSDNSISTKAKALGGYIHSFVANNEAKMSGFDDALVLDDHGYVVEANVANLIMRYRDRILVPTLASGALEGITIRTAVELLQLKGYKVEEAHIDRSMVYTCDELIATGTAVQVGYVINVDGRKIGTIEAPVEDTQGGKLYKELESEFEKLMKGEHQRSKDYLFYFDVK